VSRQRLTHTSIVGKAAIAVVAFALALSAVAWVAVRATGDATKGAMNDLQRNHGMPRHWPALPPRVPLSDPLPTIVPATCVACSSTMLGSPSVRRPAKSS